MQRHLLETKFGKKEAEDSKVGIFGFGDVAQLLHVRCDISFAVNAILAHLMPDGCRIGALAAQCGPRLRKLGMVI